MKAAASAPRGRGAVSNPTGRFESQRREAFDDGWPADPPGTPQRTSVRDEAIRSLLSYNASPDIPFDRAINPYRGCEHGCIYCYARPSHGYLGMSAGLDFETKLVAKPQAAEVLARELAKKSYTPAVLCLGANTDPYQPLERERGITREILQVLAAHKHPVSLITKSNLVLRDLDILVPMAAHKLASVAISVTTLQRDLARAMEPRAAAPQRRIEALAALQAAGVPTRVMCAPMIPALTDTELESILAAAAAVGVRHASYILLRLPHEIKDLFAEWLQVHCPQRAAHVLSLMRQCHDGALYTAEFGNRMRGSGVFAHMLEQRFGLACKRLGFARSEPGLRTDLFAVPPKAGDQLPLF